MAIFWDPIASHIDATYLPVISKFTYLLSLLEGDARNVVLGLAHTSVNYPVACDLLKEHYGKSERIIFVHIQALLNGHININVSGSKGVTQLWKLRDKILIHIRSLGSTGRHREAVRSVSCTYHPLLSAQLTVARVDQGW